MKSLPRPRRKSIRHILTGTAGNTSVAASSMPYPMSDVIPDGMPNLFFMV